MSLIPEFNHAGIFFTVQSRSLCNKAGKSNHEIVLNGWTSAETAL